MSSDRMGVLIHTMRKSRNLTQTQLAQYVGVSQSAIGMWESGQRKPTYENLEALTDVFNVPMSALLEDDPDYIRMPHNLTKMSNIEPHSIPLIGSVAGGEPILAEESYEVYVDAPQDADYALRLEGNSMSPLYEDGDVIYIRQTDDVDDGTIAVVLLDDSATLKRVYHIPNGVQLLSENPRYKPMIRTFDTTDVIRILGVPVGYTRMFKRH